MTEYLRLRLRQTGRTLAVAVPGRMVAMVVAGLVVAGGIQFTLAERSAGALGGSGAQVPDRLLGEVGYAVLLLVAMSLVTGPQSSRFPCSPADVAWVYASPIPTSHIVWSQVAWLSARRALLWVLGGMIADVVAMAVLETGPGVFLVRAVLATPLLTAMVVLSVGAGSTRGSSMPTRAAVGLGAAFGAAIVLPPVLSVLGGSTAGDALDGAPFTALARSLGALFFGEYDGAATAAIAALVLVGAGLCQLRGDGLREQLTLDATFWADFTMTAARAGGTEPKPSFRRLSVLAGAWSVLWFEIAVLRRANYQRWSFVTLLATAVLTGAFASELIPLVSFAAPISLVTGAYLSGVGRHLRLRTLLVVPGRTSTKVVAAEALHVGLACVGLCVGLAVGGAVGGYSGGEVSALVAQGTVLVAVAFAVRVATAGLAFRDGGLPGGPYHLTLAAVAAVAGTLVVAETWAASELGASRVIAIAGLAATAAALSAAALVVVERRIGRGGGARRAVLGAGAPYHTVSPTG